MINTSLLRQQLIKAVEQIVSCVQEDRVRVILAQPPMASPAGIQVQLHSGRPLTEKKRERSHNYLHCWPENQLHSIYFPCLGYILEGEADWRIGVTRSMAQKHPQELSHCDYQILTLPKHTFFLMPPGVPFSTAGVHWERSQPEQAFSRILWLNILPSGVYCHLCKTQQGQHISDATLFIRDTYLEPLIELLIHELQTRAPRFEAASRALLLTLMLRTGRKLVERKAFESDADESNFIYQQAAQEWIAPISEQAVKRACGFIELHLQESLTPAQIAAYAYVSPSHLNRLFRAELGISLMKYVTERRVETAKSLLSDSGLPIQEVGRLVGYTNSSHFTQVFSKEVSVSPLEYRNRDQGNSLFMSSGKSASQK